MALVQDRRRRVRRPVDHESGVVGGGEGEREKYVCIYRQNQGTIKK